MNKASKQQAIIQQLRAMAHEPEEQGRFALELLEKERSSQQVVSAALAVVSRVTMPGTRPVLLRLYDYYDASGVKRDAGGTLRTLIIGALLPIAEATDWTLADRAVKTYEFLPPGRRESTGGLRAAGLTLLNNLDPVLAGYHATRLLVDPYTSRMNGDPAVSAARQLAVQRQFLPLYMYVLESLQGRESVPEVTGECLRSLGDAPSSIVDGLFALYMAAESATKIPTYEKKDDLELVGLFDLLLAQSPQASYLDFIKTFLQTTNRYEVYHYLATAIIAEHRAETWAILQEVARKERKPEKIEILLSAFELVQHDPAIAELVWELQGRV
jgi:hypothetical protein